MNVIVEKAGGAVRILDRFHVMKKFGDKLNKVLEALAMGIPTVGTTPATQGVEGEAGHHFLVADDAASFADAVTGLLLDEAGAGELGRRGRAFVEERYDWDACLSPLDYILRSVREGGAASHAVNPEPSPEEASA